MAVQRDAATRLHDVRDKIQALYTTRGDTFNLPMRYEALLTLEAKLLEQLEGAASEAPHV